jgi:hypothetical protein|tara:strand:+ start:405 stop:716 length:312 start_codon:yes stop_codon:yes gene_type:complete
MAPPPGSIGGVNNTPPVLGRNPTNYGNYMQQQQNLRLAELQQNTPQIGPNLSQMQNQSTINQPAINAYMPQQLPQAPVPQQQQYPQQQMAGLTSLPGAGEFKL